MNRKMSGLSLLFINHIPFMYSISLRVRNGWFYSEKKKKKNGWLCFYGPANQCVAGSDWHK